MSFLKVLICSKKRGCNPIFSTKQWKGISRGKDCIKDEGMLEKINLRDGSKIKDRKECEKGQGDSGKMGDGM